MKLPLDKNWFERKLERDEDFEVGVGTLNSNRKPSDAPTGSEPQVKDPEAGSPDETG